MKKSLKLLITSIITILMIVSSIPITAFAAESIAAAKVTIKYSAYTYTGKAITPDNRNGGDDITVTLNGKTLTKDTDYTVRYTNNIKVGNTATIIIEGIKKYNGKVTKTFIIKPAKNKIVSYYTTNTGHFTLNWEEGTNGTVGYQILYSQDKELLKSATGEMKNADEAKYVHSYTTTKLKNPTANFTSKTQANKTYYVKVRSFYTKDGTTTSTRYGNYSDVVEIHTTNDKTFTRGIGGATAWVAVPGDATETVKINNKMYKNGTRLKMLYLDDTGVYVEVISDGNIGHINFTNIFVNLKDLEPDIIGNITNTSKSIYTSSGYSISYLTGQRLYNWRNSEWVAMRYSTAKQVAQAQRNAHKNGYNLKIYDAYRPYYASVNACDRLQHLYNTNTTVQKGINQLNYTINGIRGTSFWGTSWFIAQGISAHNLGLAVDVTLVPINSTEEVKMPSAMHELSTLACKRTSKTGAKIDSFSTNKYAVALNGFFTSASSNISNPNMTDLASEWWHYQSVDKSKYPTSTPCNFDLQ